MAWKIFITWTILAYSYLGWACEGAFDVVAYKPGTNVEIVFNLDINPVYTAHYVDNFNNETHIVHWHRLNGEDIPFQFPPDSKFVEGAKPADVNFYTSLEFNIFTPGTYWTFYPSHADTSLWKKVLGRLDRVIDIEFELGKIDKGMADFAKTYHHGLLNRNVSHIFLQEPPDGDAEEAWESISIIHGGNGGGMFPGPYADPYRRWPLADNLLQIEVAYPEVELRERKESGDFAQMYEFVRLGSVHSTKALEKLMPAVARHLVQKNGLIGVVENKVGGYFLVPTAAHERFYKNFFKERGIEIEHIADVRDGYKIYRVRMVDLIKRFLNVRFKTQE